LLNFKSMSIARKLPLALLISALLVSAGVGIGSYVIGSQAVGNLAQRNLATLASERGSQLSVFVKSIEADLVATSRTETTIQALRDFASGWMAIKGDKAAALQKSYIGDNPNPADKRALLDTDGTTGTYNIAHARFQPAFRMQTGARGYSDLYLFDASGNLVYTVNKLGDFASNFTAESNPLAKSGLATAYTAANGLTDPDAVTVVDFSAYGPSAAEPAAFFAKPVFNATGRKIGVLAVQISPLLLDKVIGSRMGLGDTGEALIVGKDGLLRSDSSFTTTGDALQVKLASPVVEAAIAGTPSAGVSSAYRGMDMLIAASPMEIAGLDWAMVAVMGANEVYAPVVDMRNMMLLIGAALLIVVAAVSLLFTRTVTKPITRLTDTMAALAEGKYDTEVRDGERSDEIGAMARAVEVFRENGQKVSQMTEAEAARIISDEAKREKMMLDLQKAFGNVVDAAVAGDFSQRVTTAFPDAALNTLAKSINNLVETVQSGLGETGQVLAALANTDLTQRMHGDYRGAFGQLKADTNAVADKLTGIVGQLKDTSRTLKIATGEILSGANDLSERTTRQAATIEETSAAMEQLAATVMDSATKAEDASTKAKAVSRAAEEGGETMAQATGAMERITESSSKISNIIGMIDDIAFQTNLLALNASVEAARAGEAGKGFAVVAIEVRRLAQSAAQASADVKQLVERSASEVRDGSKLVAHAAGKLHAMLGAVRENNLLLESIAKASRAQASSIDEVTVAVRQMDEMTQHNAALVEETNAAIEQTEGQASELDRVIDIFTMDEAVGERARTGTRSAHVARAPVRAKTVALSLVSNTNAAIDKDWSEF